MICILEKLFENTILSLDLKKIEILCALASTKNAKNDEEFVLFCSHPELYGSVNWICADADQFVYSAHIQCIQTWYFGLLLTSRIIAHIFCQRWMTVNDCLRDSTSSSIVKAFSFFFFMLFSLHQTQTALQFLPLFSLFCNKNTSPRVCFWMHKTHHR